MTGQPSESQVRQPLLVATCHVHWDPEYCDVKLIQTMILMSELKNIIEESQRSFRPGSTAPACNNIPLILCGDFNSLPDSGGWREGRRLFVHWVCRSHCVYRGWVYHSHSGYTGSIIAIVCTLVISLLLCVQIIQCTCTTMGVS